MPHQYEINTASYYERNQLLLKLGFKTYEDYLKSKIWKSLKVEVFTTYGDECFLCLGKAVVIHHHKYTLKNLNGRSVRALYPLCDLCHEKIEFREDGTKRMLAEVKSYFNSLKQGFPERLAKRRKEQKRRRRLLGRI